METFSALLAICAGNSPVPGEFPTQRPVTRSFDFFIGIWINGWVNNREVGDYWRYCALYVNTKLQKQSFQISRYITKSVLVGYASDPASYLAEFIITS